MFVITLITVYSFLMSGFIGEQADSVFFAMYFSFVIIVLIADIYHRSIVLPRLEAKRQKIARIQQQKKQLCLQLTDNYLYMNAFRLNVPMTFTEYSFKEIEMSHLGTC